MKTPLWICCTIALALSFPCLCAESSFEVKKVKVQCDGGIQVGVKTKEAHFSGNVDLLLDDFRLQCQKLDIHYEEVDGKTEVVSLLATGNVVCEQASRQLSAWSDRVEYDRPSNQLVFSSLDQTKVFQGENRMNAKTIRINVETGVAVADGGGSIEIKLDQ